MKRFCTVLFSAAVLLAAVLSASCSDVSSGSQGGDTAQVPGGGTAPGAELSAPTIGAIGAASSSSVRLTWNSVSGATKYLVYKSKKSSNSSASLVGSTTLTYKTVTGLEANTKYYFWVKAANNTTTSGYSLFDYATTETASSSGGSSFGSGGSGTTTTLSAPTGLYATAESSSSIRLTWDSVSGATKYYVYKSQYASFATSDSYSTTSTFMTVTGLKANTKYYFRVQAANSTTTSGYSASDYATTEAAASWTPPTRYQELTNLGAANAIKGNVSAGNVYWFRLYASQPSSSTYTYTISFYDKDTPDYLFSGSGGSNPFSSDVVATYYNQNGVIYASDVDNGSFGPSCSYLLSQYLYVKVECKKNGSFAIYAERKK